MAAPPASSMPDTATPDATRPATTHPVTSVATTAGPSPALGNGTAACLAAPTLEGLLAGRLEGAALQHAERHLADCPTCNGRLLTLAGPIPDGAAESSSSEPAASPETLRVLGAIAQAAPFPGPLFPPAGGAPAGQKSAELAGFVELSFVGRGGSGTVYRARQASLGRWVALKVLSAETTPRSAARAQREAQALASLNHPHVVTVHEAHLLHSPPCLVMEWVAGGSLHDQLSQGPLSIAQATRLARQLAEGVAAVHALGLIHRDLKPANVLLARPTRDDGLTVDQDAPFQAKITDFGLAQPEAVGVRTTQEGLAVGTPAYMAPEQTGLRLGLGKVGPACDLYGVGAVVFAALTGRPPHAGETPMAVLASVAWTEPPWLCQLRSEVPVDLATIVAKCLRTSPSERYRSARELIDDLARLERGEAIEARSYTPREQLRNWMRRHPTLAVAAGLGGTLLLASILGVTYHLGQLRQSVTALEAEQERVSTALAQARQATIAERDLRRETIRQVANAHRVMLESLRHVDAITSDDARLLRLIRNFYHQQVQSSTGLGPELAEILGEGLTTLSFLESHQYQLPNLALEDTSLVLGLSHEHPESMPLLLSRAHSLNVRRQILRQVGRDAEADAALDEITALAGQEAITDPPTDHKSLVPSLLAMLWHAEDWSRALSLLERTLERELARSRAGERSSESWQALLALQSQRAGLLSRLERWPEADGALAEWLAMSHELQSLSPRLGDVLAAERVRLASQHLQLAGPHLPADRQLKLLSVGRELFANLHRLPVPLKVQIPAYIDWLEGLESLPDGVVSRDELEATTESLQEAIRLAGPRGPQLAVLPALIRLRLRHADRAITEQRPAEALQLARGNLADLDAGRQRVSLEHTPLWRESLDVAARACRELSQPAEELSYLSRARELAPEDERASYRERLARAAGELGVPWVDEPVKDAPAGE
ncbi:MAG: protein kinase domain-containing protein [Planctomycetaceae bacterium]